MIFITAPVLPAPPRWVRGTAAASRGAAHARGRPRRSGGWCTWWRGCVEHLWLSRSVTALRTAAAGLEDAHEVVFGGTHSSGTLVEVNAYVAAPLTGRSACRWLRP